MTDEPIYRGCYPTEREKERKEFFIGFIGYLIGTATGLFIAVALAKFL